MTWIAFLRGINVGGNNLLPMVRLKAFLSDLEFHNVQTLLQSGNAVFQTGKKSGASLEKLLETESQRRLALNTDYFVRSAQQLAEVIRANPFPDEAVNDPGRLLVMWLKSKPSEAGIKALLSSIRGRERVRCIADCAYIVFPDGSGSSKLTSAVIDSRLSTRCTGRNWNTILKLAALAGVAPAGTD
jgi:uncharacterized protein (DUF1697 family)